MSLQKRSRFTVILVLIATAVAFMAVGCSKSPVKSDMDTEPTLLRRASISANGAILAPVNLSAEAVISSEEGGILSLLDVTLEIPAGAVPNDTLFSIFIPDDEVFYNEFGTHGLIFDKPVKVTMSYRNADLTGINESTVRIAWFNNNVDQFEDVQCEIDFENKTVTAYLSHFSAYGLISDRQITFPF